MKIRNLIPWALVIALGVAVFNQQMQLDSMRNLLADHTKAIASLASDTSENSAAISNLSDGLNSASESISSIDEMLKLLAATR